MRNSPNEVSVCDTLLYISHIEVEGTETHSLIPPVRGVVAETPTFPRPYMPIYGVMRLARAHARKLLRHFEGSNAVDGYNFKPNHQV